MNSWKVIWESFYINSSRTAVALEAWRLSSWRLRILVMLSVIAFLIYLFIFILGSRSGTSLVLMVFYELILLFALDRLKETIFSGEYGPKDNGMIPPDKESHRESRYVIFRKKLAEHGITKSHIDDTLLIVESKLDLETSHGEISKKYLGFSLGVLSGILIALIGNLDVKETIFWASMLVFISGVIFSLLRGIPSRMERLKELKYFMRLYYLEAGK